MTLKLGMHIQAYFKMKNRHTGTQWIKDVGSTRATRSCNSQKQTESSEAL